MKGSYGKGEEEIIGYIKMELLEDEQLTCEACGERLKGSVGGTTVYIGLKVNGGKYMKHCVKTV